MQMNRRTVLAAAGASVAANALSGVAMAAEGTSFPRGFLWGAATAAHQVEGNNTASDLWVLENVTPTFFAEPSGDADNSFELWPTDLDLVRDLGLNTYRFSLEWARIEPEPGRFSIAMLDHYKAMIDGCRQRRLTPVVTFNHYTTPRWFAANGAWVQPDAADLFADFCNRAARHLAEGIAYAATLNEPNVTPLLAGLVAPKQLAELREKVSATNAAAARAIGSKAFGNVIFPDPHDVPVIQAHLIAAHKAAKAAIKAARSDLPVGVTLAMMDDEAASPHSLRDARRQVAYGAWLEAVKGDDFLGVQNYARILWGDEGRLPAPPGAKRNGNGDEVYPPSLANAVRYAHQATGIPILVTEHGAGTDDDSVRAWLIPAALAELREAIAEGTPVLGYIHWSLLDNFEWQSGYKAHFGLCSVDRTTFKRTPKPSASVLAAIARRNAV
jgi:beta-glucosidase